MLREMLKGMLPGLEGEVLASNCEHVESEGDSQPVVSTLSGRGRRGRGRSPARTASGQDGRVVVVVTRSVSATAAEVKSERIRILTPAPCKGADIYITGIAFDHTCNNITAIHQPARVCIALFD
ncbi:hypothetical protein N9L68_07195 [bacterium]|nr:hypothetical protein [bacterium]